jgi:tetratricopeptide (TPR) repeat protein
MRIHSNRVQWLALIGIVLLTFTAYSSAILHGGFIWDDDDHVTQNPLLTAPHGLWQIWTKTKSETQYYPLVFTTFWVERRLWGLNPMGYHTVNVLLHTINAILVWRLLRRLEVRGAWMIGAIFAVHPVHVESVAWITERKNVLSGLFYLLALGCYLRFESGRRWAWYAGALGLFILALLSKTVTATLVVALLLIRWLRGWRIGWREVGELVPFLVIGAAMGLLTKWYEAQVVGAEGLDWNLSMGEHLLVAGRALAFYVMKLVWPTNLTFSYPRWQLDIHDPTQWSWVLGVGLIGLVFWWKRFAWGRGPFVGLAFFAVSLAPALGFVNIYTMRYSFVADHYQYLASIGIIALVIGSVAWGGDRWITSDPHGRGHILKWMMPVLGSAVLVILVALTWEQGQIYHDPKTLWQDTLNKNPDSKLSHNNLGNIYKKEGRFEEAIQQYLAVIRLQPDFINAHNNLGTAYAAQGYPEKAIQEYLIEISRRPGHIDAHYNLGTAYAKQGQLEKAAQEYLTVLKLQPNYIDAHNNLGNVYKLQGHLEEAMQEYLTVLKLQPNHIAARYNLGAVYAQQGQLENAIQEYLTVVKLQPDHISAHYNLGNVYKLKGSNNEARKQFEIVLKLNPNIIPAQKALESLDSQSGQHAFK